MNGVQGFSQQFRLLAIQFDHATATLLDYSRHLTIKTMELHILMFMKVVDLDLSFHVPKNQLIWIFVAPVMVK